MKLPFKSKQAIPILIAVIFLGFIMAVFSQFSFKSEKATLIIDFGQPGQSVQKEVTIISNTTALKLISTQVSRVSVNENGTLNCINTICRTENGEWKTYKITSSQFGTGFPINSSLEKYNIFNGDVLFLRYEMNLIGESESENSTESTAENASSSV